METHKPELLAGADLMLEHVLHACHLAHPVLLNLLKHQGSNSVLPPEWERVEALTKKIGELAAQIQKPKPEKHP
jgi:hypothetical protein